MKINKEVLSVKKSDYSELIEVWESSVRATHDFLKEEDIQNFKPLILNQYFDLVDLRCIKAEAGKILGFLGVAENKIEMLFILPEARGSGIGKILTNYAVKDLHINEVDVNEDNEQAVGFYYRMGFKLKSRSELDAQGKPFPILHLSL